MIVRPRPSALALFILRIIIPRIFSHILVITLLAWSCGCTDHRMFSPAHLSAVPASRCNGEHVVLMSMADYNSMTETLHLLSTEANAKRLWKSIASLRAGKVLDQELIHDESEKAQKHRNKQEARAAVLGWTVEGWEDYLWWQENNPKIVREINKLVQECLGILSRAPASPSR